MSPIVAVGEPVVLPDAFLAALPVDLRRELLAAVEHWDRHRSREGGHHITLPGAPTEPRSIVSNCRFCLMESKPDLMAERLERR